MRRRFPRRRNEEKDHEETGPWLKPFVLAMAFSAALEKRRSPDPSRLRIN